MVYLLDLTENCSDYALAAILKLAQDVIGYIQMIVPILLIVSLGILITRMVANPDEKKNNKRLFNVIIAALVVFLVPTAMSLVLGMLPDEFAGLELGACWRNAQNVTYATEYTPTGMGKDPDSFTLNLDSLSKAVAGSSDNENSGNSGSSGSTNTPGAVNCGGTNLAGKTIQCISGEGLGVQIVNYALSFVGYPYVYGGRGEELTTDNFNAIKSKYPGHIYLDDPSINKGSQYLDKGFLAWDCSGFTHYVYEKNGISIGNSTTEQKNDGIAIGSLSEAKPGDLLLKFTAEGKHVAIYAGYIAGKPAVVHASTTSSGTIVSLINDTTYPIIRRVIPS